MELTTLLHISGGQDSTYVAYKWLQENPNEKILLHHVNLQHTAENRLEYEKTAVEKILTFFNKSGLTNYEYHESTFLYGSLPRISIKDIQIVSVFSSIILKTPKWNTIQKLLLSWHINEVNRDDIKKGFRVKKMLEALEVGREIEFVFPIENMTRVEMARRMPIDLLKSVHCCRRPINGNKCGRCHTCIELKENGIFDI